MHVLVIHLYIKGVNNNEQVAISMAVASGPAGPALAGPVFTFAFKIAHAQTINNWQ